MKTIILAKGLKPSKIPKKANSCLLKKVLESCAKEEENRPLENEFEYENLINEKVKLVGDKTFALGKKFNMIYEEKHNIFISI